MSNLKAKSTKEAATAAIQKRQKKVKSSTSLYYLYAGGVAAICVSVLWLVLSENSGKAQTKTVDSSKAIRREFVNDDALIADVNKNAQSWTAARQPFFGDLKIADLKKQLHTKASRNMAGSTALCNVDQFDIPQEFDARVQWPACFESHPIYDQKDCNAAWAIPAVSSVANRICIAEPNKFNNLMLSVQNILACDTDNNGCKSGKIDGAWNFLEDRGIVSENCQSFKPSNLNCTAKCAFERPLRSTTHCYMSDAKLVMMEIAKNGPVVAMMSIFNDFLVYKEGVYSRLPTAMPVMAGKRPLTHAVKIIGWGGEGSDSYWLIENSFGQQWGEGGIAKVVRSDDPSIAVLNEDFIMAGTAFNQPKPDFAKSLEEDLDAEFDEADAETAEEEIEEEIEA